MTLFQKNQIYDIDLYLYLNSVGSMKYNIYNLITLADYMNLQYLSVDYTTDDFVCSILFNKTNGLVAVFDNNTRLYLDINELGKHVIKNKYYLGIDKASMTIQGGKALQ
jgi:hypothetical protein